VSEIELPGQPRAALLLQRAVDRPAHAYLLAGPSGTGKADAARAFAAALLGCPVRRVVPGSHPDLVIVEPPGEQVMMEQVQELQSGLRYRPQEAPRRVGIMFEADRLNRDAANAFLKSLEEPPGEVVHILIADELAAVLPTIRSRCQVVPFQRMGTEAIAERLIANGEERASAERLARRARGDLGLARRLADHPVLRDWLDGIERDCAGLLRGDEVDVIAAASAAMTGIKEAGALAEASAVEETEGRLALLERLPRSRELDRERRRLEQDGKALAGRRRRRAESDLARAAIDAMALVLRDLVCVQGDAPDLIASSVPVEVLTAIAAGVQRTRCEAAIRSLMRIGRSLSQPVNVPLAIDAAFAVMQGVPHGERVGA
jgi:DNA polymerase-3 subunit delta'